MDNVTSMYRVFLYKLVDIVMAAGAMLGLYTLAIASTVPGGLGHFFEVRLTIRNLIICGLFLLLWHIACRTAGLYSSPCRSTGVMSLRVLAACSAGSTCALIFPVASNSGLFSFPLVFWFWVVVLTGMIAVRLLAGLIHAMSRPLRQIVVVGTGPLADAVCETLRRLEDGVEVVGFVDSRDAASIPAPYRHKFLGHTDQLDSLLMHLVVDQVMIALPVKSCYDTIQDVIATCERVGVPAAFSCDLFDYRLARPTIAGTDVRLSHIYLAVAANDGRLVIKRVLDLLFAFAALVVLGPLMLAIAVAIRSTSSGPAIFVQERYGLHKRRFRMLKFRTMVTEAEEMQMALENSNEVNGPAFKMRNDPRVTSLGRVLRKTSLDELPQLFNVLVGDMSLVGPRPLPIRDVSRFDQPWLMRRFSVKPGLTCLWQIAGRSNLQFDSWIKEDLHYIDHWSLTLDMKILLLTIPAVVRGDGAA